MPTLKIAVIVDDMGLKRYARDAVDAIRGCDEISVFSCTNTRFRGSLTRHAAYYALNLLAMRSAQTRIVGIEGTAKRIAARIEFESEYDGAWQRLPDAVVERLAGYDLVLRFGMGLLRIPPAERLAVPILSFHHGDPDRFRGRPAGFYEMLGGEPAMGQIVQILSNKVDAGIVVAFAETKVFPHSYRATLVESYRHSPLLINQAIANAMAERGAPKASGGRKYRLPSNLTVLRFTARMAGRYASRLVYGALFEKMWQVSTAPLPAGGAVDAILADFPAADSWEALEVAAPYVFYADPFFVREPPAILVEAVRRRTGLGEILLVDDTGHRPALQSPGHASYPMTAKVGGREIILPELASWSPPTAYSLEDGAMRALQSLRVEGEPRILDPTLIEQDGRLYLFGNRRDVGGNALFLWSAESLEDEFRLHPASPVRISPKGARMAGGLIRAGGQRLIRLGQNYLAEYGHGIFAFEVEVLSASDYAERPIGEIRFADRRGPHTLNMADGKMVFDWYRDRVSPAAGVRRVMARWWARRGLSRRTAGNCPTAGGLAITHPSMLGSPR
jgi:hypothetical protein